MRERILFFLATGLLGVSPLNASELSYAIPLRTAKLQSLQTVLSLASGFTVRESWPTNGEARLTDVVSDGPKFYRARVFEP